MSDRFVWFKSSHSNGHSHCVEVAWRKSSHSQVNGHCVETAQAGERVLVRDSKNPDGGMLAFSTDAWHEFTTMIKNDVIMPRQVNRG